jgi:hypothetical protein
MSTTVCSVPDPYSNHLLDLDLWTRNAELPYGTKSRRPINYGFGSQLDIFVVTDKNMLSHW